MKIAVSCMAVAFTIMGIALAAIGAAWTYSDFRRSRKKR